MLKCQILRNADRNGTIRERAVSRIAGKTVALMTFAVVGL